MSVSQTKTALVTITPIKPTVAITPTPEVVAHITTPEVTDESEDNVFGDSD